MLFEFLFSGRRHGGEFTVRQRVRVHRGRPDSAVWPRKAPGQRHQPLQGGEEEGERQRREGEEAGGREGKGEGETQERHAEGTRGHVQVKMISVQPESVKYFEAFLKVGFLFLAQTLNQTEIKLIDSTPIDVHGKQQGFEL